MSLQLSVLGEENVKLNIIKVISFYRELFPLYHIKYFFCILHTDYKNVRNKPVELLSLKNILCFK